MKNIFKNLFIYVVLISGIGTIFQSICFGNRQVTTSATSHNVDGRFLCNNGFQENQKIMIRDNKEAICDGKNRRYDGTSYTSKCGESAPAGQMCLIKPGASDEYSLVPTNYTINNWIVTIKSYTTAVDPSQIWTSFGFGNISYSLPYLSYGNRTYNGSNADISCNGYRWVDRENFNSCCSAPGKYDCYYTLPDNVYKSQFGPSLAGFTQSDYDKVKSNSFVVRRNIDYARFFDSNKYKLILTDVSNTASFGKKTEVDLKCIIHENGVDLFHRICSQTISVNPGTSYEVGLVSTFQDKIYTPAAGNNWNIQTPRDTTTSTATATPTAGAGQQSVQAPSQSQTTQSTTPTTSFNNFGNLTVTNVTAKGFNLSWDITNVTNYLTIWEGTPYRNDTIFNSDENLTASPSVCNLPSDLNNSSMPCCKEGKCSFNINKATSNKTYYIVIKDNTNRDIISKSVTTSVTTAGAGQQSVQAPSQSQTTQSTTPTTSNNLGNGNLTVTNVTAKGFNLSWDTNVTNYLTIWEGTPYRNDTIFNSDENLTASPSVCNLPSDLNNSSMPCCKEGKCSFNINKATSNKTYYIVIKDNTNRDIISKSVTTSVTTAGAGQQSAQAPSQSQTTQVITPTMDLKLANTTGFVFNLMINKTQTFTQLTDKVGKNIVVLGLVVGDNNYPAKRIDKYAIINNKLEHTDYIDISSCVAHNECEINTYKMFKNKNGGGLSLTPNTLYTVMLLYNDGTNTVNLNKAIRLGTISTKVIPTITNVKISPNDFTFNINILQGQLFQDISSYENQPIIILGLSKLVGNTRQRVPRLSGLYNNTSKKLDNANSDYLNISDCINPNTIGNTHNFAINCPIDIQQRFGDIKNDGTSISLTPNTTYSIDLTYRDGIDSNYKKTIKQALKVRTGQPRLDASTPIALTGEILDIKDLKTTSTGFSFSFPITREQTDTNVIGKLGKNVVLLQIVSSDNARILKYSKFATTYENTDYTDISYCFNDYDEVDCNIDTSKLFFQDANGTPLKLKPSTEYTVKLIIKQPSLGLYDSYVQSFTNANNIKSIEIITGEPNNALLQPAQPAQPAQTRQPAQPAQTRGIGQDLRILTTTSTGFSFNFPVKRTETDTKLSGKLGKNIVILQIVLSDNTRVAKYSKFATYENTDYTDISYCFNGVASDEDVVECNIDTTKLFFQDANGTPLRLKPETEYTVKLIIKQPSLGLYDSYVQSNANNIKSIKTTTGKLNSALLQPAQPAPAQPATTRGTGQDLRILRTTSTGFSFNFPVKRTETDTKLSGKLGKNIVILQIFLGTTRVAKYSKFATYENTDYTDISYCFNGVASDEDVVDCNIDTTKLFFQDANGTPLRLSNGMEYTVMLTLKQPSLGLYDSYVSANNIKSLKIKTSSF